MLNINKDIVIQDSNRTLEQISQLNTNKYGFVLSSIAENSDVGNKSIGIYTIPEDGCYLICGYYNPNYYMKTGRELNMLIKKNNDTIFTYNKVINGAYTVTASFCVTAELNKNDVVNFIISNSAAQTYAVYGGIAHFIKLY